VPLDSGYRKLDCRRFRLVEPVPWPSRGQKAYVANDPRWPEHRRKLAAAQEAKRMTLMENEVAAIIEMRENGRNFSYIAEKIGVCREVIGPELSALGISTAPAKPDRRMTLMENEVAAIVYAREGP
jgi:hypothetical protein